MVKAGFNLAILSMLITWMSIAFVLVFAGFLILHFYLLSQNRTTLENMQSEILIRLEGRVRKVKIGIYKLDWYRNFTSVFGQDKTLWLWPSPVEVGDGHWYPLSSNIDIIE
jgi:hypothetical protein